VIDIFRNVARYSAANLSLGLGRV